MEMIKLLIVMQERQKILEIFLFHIWTDVLMSHDDVKQFSSPLVSKQNVIQQVLGMNILIPVNPSNSHLRTKTEKTWELIMFILIN